MPTSNIQQWGFMVYRLALLVRNPALTFHIRARPVRMLLGVRLQAHYVHCKCRSTNERLRGATAITQTVSFFTAIKKAGHRNNTEYAREQREHGLLIFLFWIRTCCLCAVPLPAESAMSLSDDTQFVLCG